MRSSVVSGSTDTELTDLATTVPVVKGRSARAGGGMGTNDDRPGRGRDGAPEGYDVASPRGHGDQYAVSRVGDDRDGVEAATGHRCRHGARRTRTANGGQLAFGNR